MLKRNAEEIMEKKSAKNRCRYRAAWLLIAVLLLPAQSIAQDRFMFGILANHTAIEVLGEAGFYTQPSTVYAGASGVFYEDRYTMLGAHAMVGNKIHGGFTGKIGFKGFWGEYERTGHDDQNILALAFSISGSYDLSNVIAARYVPIVLHATASISPSPTSFDDTERFFEGIVAADWMFLQNAAITASFRYIDAKFKKWSRSHGSGYLGFKFVF